MSNLSRIAALMGLILLNQPALALAQAAGKTMRADCADKAVGAGGFCLDISRLGSCLSVRGANLSVAVGICLLYWLAMVVVRWNRVAKPSRYVLRAQIASLQAQLKTLLGTAPPPAPINHAAELLAAASGLVDDTVSRSSQRWLDFLFWSRGQEITGWGYTYEAQTQMVALLGLETVRVRLEDTANRLALEQDAASRSLATVAKQALATQPAPKIDRLGALLAQALACSYDSEYNTYSALVSWQNKASWLVGCGLLLIVTLTASFPTQAVLFLAGATGGLLSRLSRSLNRKDAPTDYGASWTTLFLSPVAGALGGWVGVLVAALAVQLKVLNAAMGVDWEKPYGPMVLAVALAFGFSERLLDGVFDKIDDKALNQIAPAKAGAKSTPFAINDPGPLQIDAQQSGAVQLSATGAVGDVTWTLVQPAPAGVTLSPDGVLKWAAALAKANVIVSVQAEDGANQETKTRQLTMRAS
jgi:hypothetical protein